MNSDKNNIDKFIKAKIEHQEMMPDVDLWNSIEASLITKNKFGYIYKGITVLAVAIICTGIFYLYTNTKKSEPNSSIQIDPIKEEILSPTDNKNALQKQLSEPNPASYISKESIINHSKNSDSIQTAAGYSRDSIIHPATAIEVSKDTSAFISVPIEKKVVKKVVKKPVYVIQQDTIYKIDSLKRRRIK